MDPAEGTNLNRQSCSAKARSSRVHQAVWPMFGWLSNARRDSSRTRRARLRAFQRVFGARPSFSARRCRRHWTCRVYVRHATLPRRDQLSFSAAIPASTYSPCDLMEPLSC